MPILLNTNKALFTDITCNLKKIKLVPAGCNGENTFLEQPFKMINLTNKFLIEVVLKLGLNNPFR